MAYATAEQLGTLMGRGPEGLAADEIARAQLLLQLAAGVIDTATGQSLTLASGEVTLDGNGGHRLLLPRWPVVAITSVTVLDEHEEPTELEHGTDYRWTRYGRLRRVGGRWPHQEQSIIADVTAGWDPIPDDVVGMNLRLALAGWENISGKESERLGDWNAKWAVPGMLPTTGELNMLSAYQARS
ncbi:hypothetical protein ACLQ2R_03200 [Streptosporangium sp. DT93]|uniref:hypothetical protein n=1 Tax=Streptosporangium sp. DT93 TaxID=3393428 RepID=UPI003CFA7865